MSDTVGIAGDRIRSLVARIEQLDAEIQALNEGKKEVFSEAKGRASTFTRADPLASPSIFRRNRRQS